MQSTSKPNTTQPDSAKERLRAGTRRLVLIRHAKAVEDDPAGDHARGLSERGIGDARMLGAWLIEQGIQPDLVLCSTATRTRQTLQYSEIHAPTILNDKLYLAMPGEMLAQIQAVEDAVKTLVVIAHNPGTHALLGMLVGSYANEDDADRMLLKFPTSACAVLTFDAAHWREVAPESGRLVSLKY